VRKSTQRAIKEAKQLRETAYHEAGHAVAAVVMGLGLRKKGVTTLTTDGNLGYTYVRQPRKTQDGDMRYVVVLLSGGVAVGILKGEKPHETQDLYGAGTDLEYATAALCWIPDMEAKYKLRRLLYETAQELLQDNWAAVEAVAGMLIECRSLSGNQVEAVVSQTRGQLQYKGGQ